MEGLNIRQKKFVEYYIQTGNGAESYIQACYCVDRKSAEVNACRLLRIARVIHEVNKGKERLAVELREKFICDALTARKVLINILNDPQASNKDKLTAARAVLDRGGFKPIDKTDITGKAGRAIEIIFVEPNV